MNIASALKPMAEILVRIALGVFGLASLRSRARLDPGSIGRVLVIRPDLLGDAVFSLPALEAVRTAFPKAEIDVLVLPYTGPIWRSAPGLAHVVELDVNAYRRLSGWRGLPELLRTIGYLRGRRYDLAFSLSRWMGGLFAALSGARLRAGAAAETYWGCYNLPLDGRRYAPGQHEVDYCLNLARQLSPAAVADPVPRLAVQTTEVPFELPSSYVVLVPGASNGVAKRWPGEYWLELAERLTEAGVPSVLCGSAAERALLSGQPTGAIDLMGRTTVEQLAAVLAGADVVVAADTGPLHLATALGRPVVGLYGATDPANTGPRADLQRVIRLGLSCSPCYDLTGPAECKLPDRSVACMTGIEPGVVAEAVLQLRAETAVGAPAR